MSSSIKSVDDCASGRDYIELAQRNGWTCIPNGSYYDITDPESGVIVHVPDCGRTLPKETRTVINGALVKAGLVLVALVMVVCVVAAWTL